MKLGVLVNDLGPSQLAYNLIRRLNDAVSGGILADAAVFFDEPCQPCLEPRFGCFHCSEAWGCDWTLVATNLSTAARLAGFPSARKRAFYVWDLEWTRGACEYETVRRVYAHPALTLLARGREHAGLLERCWGKRASIVDDFDVQALLAALS